MDDRIRRQIRDYVAPLAVGLDGAVYYGDVERVVAAAEAIAAGRRDLHRDLLFLLAVFSGQEKWVSRLGNRSRSEIFLSSVGVAADTIYKLFSGIERLEERPGTPEEEVVHDAVRLDRLGAYGVARLLEEGRRERLGFCEMAEEIDRAAATPMRTERGEALARSRRGAMREFARQLREEVEEFGA